MDTVPAAVAAVGIEPNEALEVIVSVVPDTDPAAPISKSPVSESDATAFEPVGPDTETVAVVVKPAEAATRPASLKVVDAAVPTVVVAVLEPNVVPVDSAPKVAAFAATAVIPPIANAAAATSATRLKAVFVDIIFLSRKQSKVRISLSRLG
jgi:hypothetical protein